jgi:hypothetical protein
MGTKDELERMREGGVVACFKALYSIFLVLLISRLFYGVISDV